MRCVADFWIISYLVVQGYQIFNLLESFVLKFSLEGSWMVEIYLDDFMFQVSSSGFLWQSG